LPAVQKVRQSADKTACQNNIRQLVIALHAYHEVYQKLPGIGNASQNAFSVIAYALPFVEQQNLQKLIQFDQPLMLGSKGTQTINPIQQPAAQMVIPLLLCPSDAADPVFTAYNNATFAGTNYVCNGGTGTGTHYDDRYANDGLFWQNSRTKFHTISDGTSNTLLFSETLLGLGKDTTGATPVHPHRQMAQVSSLVKPDQTGPGVVPPLTTAICESATAWNGDRGASWIWGRYHRGAFNTYFPINYQKSDCLAHGEGWYAARSSHPGGVNVGMCDGSVRFVRQTIELATWRALSTRETGDVPDGSY
jgi:prepilin-type processing-associated H-X9-DG protein